MSFSADLAARARRGLGFLGDVERQAAGFMGDSMNSITGFRNPAPPIGPVNPEVNDPPVDSGEEMAQGQRELAAIRAGQAQPIAPPESNLDPDTARLLAARTPQAVAGEIGGTALRALGKGAQLTEQAVSGLADPLTVAEVPSNIDLLGKLGIDLTHLPAPIQAGINSARPGAFGISPEMIAQTGVGGAVGETAREGAHAIDQGLPEEAQAPIEAVAQQAGFLGGMTAAGAVMPHGGPRPTVERVETAASADAPYAGIPEDSVRMFRGENPANIRAEGAHQRGNYSPSARFAEGFAGSDGQIKYVDVPRADIDKWHLWDGSNHPNDQRPGFGFDEIRVAQQAGEHPPVLGYMEPPRDVTPSGTLLQARIPGLPSPVSARPGVPETGTRPGTLLQPRSLEQLGPNATVKDVMQVGADLRRQVGSNAVSLMAEARNADDVLGPTVRDGRGNIYLREVIKPEDGAPALKQDVLENPGRYPLTPEQAQAVDTIQSVAARARNEAESFGAKTRNTELEEGQNFIPRQAAETTSGQSTKRVGQSPGGARLRGMSERSRVYTDPLEATRAGTVYNDPIDALGKYVGENLDAAANQHIAGMLKTFGETPADRIDPKVQGLWEGANKTLASIRQRLATAESRAGIATGRADELDNALAEMSRAQPEGGARPLSKLPGALDTIAEQADRLTTEKYKRVDNVPGQPRIEMPVSPEATAKAEGLSSALARIDALVPEGTDRIRFLDTAIIRTERRLDILAQRGGQYAGVADKLRTALQGAIDQQEKLAPLWKAEQTNAAATPPGRVRVSAEAAPLLQGTDFAPGDARRISRYYNNGILPDNAIGNTLRAVKGFNQKVIPVQAIGDASSLLRQLAVALPSHPIEFAKAAGRSFYDAYVPGGWKGYQEWLSSPEARAAAKSGVELMGEGGSANTDMWAQFFERIPGLKQTQRQFEASSNRMRVSLWQQDVDMLRRTGQPVDALALEQVARNANRITGVSNARATDVETLTEFAANYLRSRLETLTKAVSDGGVEGQLARGYLKNYVSTGLMVVTAAALAQGRDPREVLNPIQVDKDGRFHMNPNFGTVRVFGTDLNVFGTYSDLASMALTVADGAYGAVKEKDAYQLSNAILQAARSKTGPAISLPWDLQTGRDAIGNPTHTWEYLLTRPLPIAGTQALQAYQNGQSLQQQLFGGAANLLGARANPVTVNEQLGQAGAAKGYGTDFNAFTPSQQSEILKENPGLAQRREEQILNGTGASAKYAAAKQRIGAQQVASDDQFQHGQLTLGQWHDETTTRAAQLREAATESFPVGRKPDPSKPWELYYAAIDNAKDPKTGTVDWNKVEAWKASQKPDVQASIDKETGLNGTPIENERSAALRKLQSDGFFNMEKYRGMRSLDSDGADAARQAVSAAVQADRRLQTMNFSDAARFVLRNEGYTPTQIQDAINAGSKQYANPTYEQYKTKHKALLAWLEPGLTYDQIHAIP